MSELRTGDTVLADGMVIRLGERKVWQDESGRDVFTFAGTVLNREELTGDDGRAVWPLTGLLRTDTDTPERMRDNPYDGAWRWTVQGNDLRHIRIIPPDELHRIPHLTV
jgi:hypothetical protein